LQAKHIAPSSTKLKAYPLTEAALKKSAIVK